MRFGLNVSTGHDVRELAATGDAGAETDETKYISHPSTLCLVSGQKKRMDCVT